MRLRRAVYYIPHKTDSRKGRRGTMTAAAFFELFHQYGLFLVCGVIFCEYMNLPGFPAGVIMPCIGVLIAQSSLSLPLTLVLSVASGLLGSLVIYGLCYWGGEPIMEKLFGKSRKFRSFVQKCHEFIDARMDADLRSAASSRCSARSFPFPPVSSVCRSSGSSAGRPSVSRHGIPRSSPPGICSATGYSRW